MSQVIELIEGDDFDPIFEEEFFATLQLGEGIESDIPNSSASDYTGYHTFQIVVTNGKVVSDRYSYPLHLDPLFNQTTRE
jgi:hypothetical protein